MIKALRVFRLCAVFLAFAALLARAQEPDRIIIEPRTPGPGSAIEHQFDAGLSKGTNGVVVRYGPTVLVANAVSLNEQTGKRLPKETSASSATRGLWQATGCVRFKTGEMSATPSSRLAPFFVSGEA